MLLRLFCCTLLMFAYTHAAMAADSVKHHIPNAQKVGEGRLSVMVWDVYDATLYAPEGEWAYDKPFILSLRYFLDLEGSDIADRSVKEMRGQGFTDETQLAAWHAEMKAIFPDVKDGSVLTAVFIPGKHTAFFYHDKLIGTIKGDSFVRWFSGIWLSEKTSEPQLRQKLLGRL